uniref:GMP synthase (glutamine-hydrolyzing) n=1 Tax=viral metagenome TaxID=1070528 RepID=A0A6C0KET7_9ZZZZ
MIEVLIVDYGSQYTQLILHKLLYDFQINVQLIDIQIFKQINYNKDYPYLKAIILSGGPNSVINENIKFYSALFKNINVLGICYGSQIIAKSANCQIISNEKSQYGICKVKQTSSIISELFHKIPSHFHVWMSHYDSILLDKTNSVIDILLVDKEENPVMWKYNQSLEFKNLIVGVLFHPEVDDTEYGLQLIKNFLSMSHIKINSDMDVGEIILNNATQDIKKIVGKDQVALALSGGVDSSTLAYLLIKVIPEQVIFILIDNGLMREGEINEILNNYTADITIKLKVIDAKKEFLNALKDITDPEEKRKIIGNLFIQILSNQMKNITYLAQGTIYPDVIESGQLPNSKVIKSHHNVGGLPSSLCIKLLEPFRYLFKDDIRKLAKLLNIPKKIIERKPFPGPGLAIRILGAITIEKLQIIKEVDIIMRKKIEENKCNIWQAAAILLPVKTVGVMGDCRTYENVVALRFVNSINGMTACAAPICINILIDIATTITNNVNGVSRVVYDLSSKPPATIEWE